MLPSEVLLLSNGWDYLALFTADVLGLDPCLLLLDLKVDLCQFTLEVLSWSLFVLNSIWEGRNGIFLVHLLKGLAPLGKRRLGYAQFLNLSLVLEFEVLTDHHQVEAYFLLAVLLDPLLDLLLCEGQPIRRALILADQDGAGLKAIKLVKIALVRHIADEVINIRLFLFLSLVLLKDEGLRSAEAVVELSDGLGVAERESSVLTGHLPRKLTEIFEIPFYSYGRIEQNR